MLRALTMTPITSRERRKQRRRDEHEARKEANRATPLAAAPLSLAPPVILSEALDFDDPEFSPELAALAKLGGDHEALEAALLSRMRSRPADTPTPAAHTDHTERNRQNAQSSTGPKTPEGKAQSSKNAFRHGLASNRFLVLDWESVDDFDDLLANLRAEHQPATQTEALLVEKMAEHFWLSQRALRLQDLCFRMDVPLCDQPRELALYMRYGATHDRAFHKCIAELARLRAARQKAEAGFESQKRQQAAETRKDELHAARVSALASKKYTKKQKIEPTISPAPAIGVVLTAEQPLERPSVVLEDTKILASVTSRAA